jgi:hypothetical protein
MQKQLKVEQILEKVSENNRKYWVVKGENQGFFVWDPNIAKQIKEGDTITFITSGGAYPQIEQLISVVRDYPAMPKPKPDIDKRIEEMYALKQERLMKAQALAVALEIIKIRQKFYEAFNDNAIRSCILENADKILEWFKQGQKPENKPKEEDTK